MANEFKCKNCGWTHERCLPSCHNCMRQGFLIRISTNKLKVAERASAGKRFSEMKRVEIQRLQTSIPGVDRVLNGGLAERGTYMITGEPGSGKSTLLLQIAGYGARGQALYGSCEQSNTDLLYLAERLGLCDSEIRVLGLSDEENAPPNYIEDLFDAWKRCRPDMVVIDSLQTYGSRIYDQPVGSALMIRYIMEQVQRLAKIKTSHATVVMVSTINKEGEFEGLKKNEHLVDGLLILRGPRENPIKELVSPKHRWGPSGITAKLKLEENGFTDVTQEEEEKEKLAASEKAAEKSEQKERRAS